MYSILYRIIRIASLLVEFCYKKERNESSVKTFTNVASNIKQHILHQRWDLISLWSLYVAGKLLRIHNTHFCRLTKNLHFVNTYQKKNTGNALLPAWVKIFLYSVFCALVQKYMYVQKSYTLITYKETTLCKLGMGIQKRCAELSILSFEWAMSAM